MATLRDVAQLAGVTVTTVSRMLNDKSNVSEKTQARIRQAMEALGYLPNEMARSLKAATSPFIGVIMPTLDTPFFASLAEEIERAAFERGYRILLCISNMNEAKERDSYTMMLSCKVAGIIQCNQTTRVEEYVRDDAPVVIMERVPRREIPSVISDNIAGGRIAAEHLIVRGCRCLACFDAPLEEESHASRRGDGLLEAVRAAGLADPIRSVLPVESILNMDFDDAIESLFHEHPEIDGVSAIDIVASRVVHCCRKLGCRVPEDVKVIGYDDSIFARLCEVPLTTSRQPIREMAAAAVDTVIRRAAGEIVPIRTVLPVQLVQREST